MQLYNLYRLYVKKYNLSVQFLLTSAAPIWLFPVRRRENSLLLDEAKSGLAILGVGCQASFGILAFWRVLLFDLVLGLFLYKPVPVLLYLA